MGQLTSARSPSALLMARIRHAYPTFVTLDEKAKQLYTREAAVRITNYRREHVKPLVWLVVRGESNPFGVGQ